MEPNPPTILCDQNSCQSDIDKICSLIQYESDIVLHNFLSIKVPLNATPGTTLPWQLVLRNRFGFTDTLQGTTLLVSAVCQETATNIECQRLAVQPHNRDTLFSWINLYANGRQDILWSKSSAMYPGTTAASPTQTAAANSIIFIPVDTTTIDTLVCPGDSLWTDTAQFFLKDFRSIVNLQSFSHDSTSVILDASDSPLQLIWQQEGYGCRYLNPCEVH